MEKQGISLRTLNAVLITLVCLFSVFVTYTALHAIAGYREMREDTERYIESEQDAAGLQAGSDYLTEQVRAFVVTGDPDRVNRYFEEAGVTRRRDRALENLDKYLSGTETYRLLSDALDTSNELMRREYRAMRLAIEAFGYDAAAFPEALGSLTLSAEDRALDREGQRALAQALVFDEAYQAYKDRISRNIDLCMEALTGELRQEQVNSSDRLLALLRIQLALIGAMVAVMLAVVLCTSRLMIRPLQRAIVHIQSGESLDDSGSSELRYLARIYNEMAERQRRDQDQLSYEASHDSLTGLYNRSAFEKFRTVTPEKDSALLLIDLDHFKTINDSYGHDVGDRALQKVASVLQASFRAEDYVCRIGGDEFAVIMVHAGSSLKELVAGKIRRANETLKQTEDGLPALSLSVGVAFGDRENPTDDIYKDADVALYRIKDGGRNGCAFY